MALVPSLAGSDTAFVCNPMPRSEPLEGKLRWVKDSSISTKQEKALDLEDKLHKKEQEHDGHVQQLSKVSQVEEDLAVPRPEAVEDLKIEVQDSIMNIQHLVETHKLRSAEVSGSALLLQAVSDQADEYFIREPELEAVCKKDTGCQLLE